MPEPKQAPPETSEESLECLRCERLKLGRDVAGIDHIPSCSWRGKGDPSVG